MSKKCSKCNQPAVDGSLCQYHSDIERGGETYANDRNPDHPESTPTPYSLFNIRT